jgi:hypothetical protein
MSEQEPFKAGDTVEITGDRRKWLNGKRGKIERIDGVRFSVKLDHVGRSREATFLLENLVKVEGGE